MHLFQRANAYSRTCVHPSSNSVYSRSQKRSMLSCRNRHAEQDLCCSEIKYGHTKKRVFILFILHQPAIAAKIKRSCTYSDDRAQRAGCPQQPTKQTNLIIIKTTGILIFYQRCSRCVCVHYARAEATSSSATACTSPAMSSGTSTLRRLIGRMLTCCVGSCTTQRPAAAVKETSVPCCPL